MEYIELLKEELQELNQKLKQSPNNKKLIKLIEQVKKDIEREKQSNIEK